MHECAAVCVCVCVYVCMHAYVLLQPSCGLGLQLTCAELQRWAMFPNTVYEYGIKRSGRGALGKDARERSAREGV